MAKQMESMTEEAISEVAENYYIQGDITVREEWQDISGGNFKMGKLCLNFATRWSQIIKL